MIFPFQRFWLRSWLRSPWFVAALVCVAVAEWHNAILRIREIQRETAFRQQLVRGLDELQRATDAIAAKHFNP